MSEEFLQKVATALDIRWSVEDVATPPQVIYMPFPTSARLEVPWGVEGVADPDPEDPDPVELPPGSGDPIRYTVPAVLDSRWVRLSPAEATPPPPTTPPAATAANWVVYDSATGNILVTEYGTLEEAQVAEDEDQTTGVLLIPQRIEALLYYVDISGPDPVLALKPRFVFDFDTRTPAANSPATLLTNPPAGTRIRLVADNTTAAGIEQTDFVHPGGVFSYTSNLKTEHRLEFSGGNYVTEEVILNVV